MIISRTPLRISFFGGGSDLPSFYRKTKGAVLSATINKYIYVTTNPSFDGGYRVAYSKLETVNDRDDIAHPIVREALMLTDYSIPLDITSVTDVPSNGSGLGSSSAFTVGLLNNLTVAKKLSIDKHKLAQLAVEVEIEKCRGKIGKQDQYAAAFGGLNFIEFNVDGSVKVDNIASNSKMDKLADDCILVYTGFGRDASSVLEKHSSSLETSKPAMMTQSKLVELAHSMRKELSVGNFGNFGECLHESWMLKKEISNSISSTELDTIYTTARSAGAIGGKVLGAGGGGFFLLVAPKEKHDAIIKSLPKLKSSKIKFDEGGSKIIFQDG